MEPTTSPAGPTDPVGRTALPASKAFAEDERSVLLGYLDYHRAVLARKVEGISEAQARVATCPPSDMTLLGMIRHMADVERFWFRYRLTAEDVGPIYHSEAHPTGDEDGDWHFPPGATLGDALATWRAEIEIADANIGSRSVDDYEQRHDDDQAPSTLRRVLVHLIEEYARHCGHADLIRQALDGQVGD